MIYGKTDIGRVRTSNQDVFCYGQPIKDVYYALVCDGMGGSKGGAVASRIALRAIKEMFEKQIRDNMNEQSVKDLMKTSFSRADELINDRVLKSPDLEGMGTTAVAAIMIGSNAYLGYVGDSRGYVSSKGILTQITSDHSYVQMLLTSGKIDEQEARNHPRRNEITRSLGASSSSQLDFEVVKLDKGDKLMLCSDGLTGVCVDEEISKILRSSEGIESVGKLIELANKNGGYDNITVVVYQK